MSPSTTDSLIAENNTITMRDRKINFHSSTLLDQPKFPITFDQFMNPPSSRTESENIETNGTIISFNIFFKMTK